MIDKIKVNKDGLNEMKLRLEKLKQEFDDNEKKMSAAYRNSSGDGAHDNAEFEYFQGIERRLAKQIDDLSLAIKNAIIVEEEYNEELVNIGDIIELEVYYEKDNPTPMVITLVGGEGNIFENKISINSPLGAAVLGKKIGDCVVYQVATQQIKTLIIGRKEDVKKKERKK